MALPGLVAAKNLADVTDRERAWDGLGQEVAANFDTPPLALAPGTPLGGGYFAGYISHTADGNPTHALILAPRIGGATGAATGDAYPLVSNLQWKTETTTTAGTNSDFDGLANTLAMIDAGISNHPAAQFCANLSIGGFTDWYLPSRFELDIAYFNFKPDTTANSTAWGINNYSVPRRTSNFTPSNPSQTSLTIFNTNTEKFIAQRHWSSTEATSSLAWALTFSTGLQQINMAGGKTFVAAVRAFRRIAV
jgi:hypothetical protein